MSSHWLKAALVIGRCEHLDWDATSHKCRERCAATEGTRECFAKHGEMRRAKGRRLRDHHGCAPRTTYGNQKNILLPPAQIFLKCLSIVTPRAHRRTINSPVLLLRCNVLRQPVETLVKALSGRGARALDEPVTLTKAVQAKLIRDLSRIHRVWQVLLVREDEQHRVAQLILVQHAVQFIARLADTVAIVGVHHEDHTLCVLEVVLPQRPDLVLATHVPHGERNVFVLHRLHVEANGRDCRDDLAKLQLIQNGGLTRGVKTNLLVVKRWCAYFVSFCLCFYFFLVAAVTVAVVVLVLSGTTPTIRVLHPPPPPRLSHVVVS